MARILIVEDNRDAGALFAHVAMLTGYACRVAEDVEQARNQLADWAPEAAVIDLFLPDVMGVEFIRELREAYPKLAIIAASAYMGHWTSEELDACGADFLLQKPVSIQALRSAIQLVLRKRNHPCDSGVCMPECLRGMPSTTIIDKTCSICNTHWQTLQDLHEDENILFLGSTPRPKKKAMLLDFNHASPDCGTTLTVQIGLTVAV